MKAPETEKFTAEVLNGSSIRDLKSPGLMQKRAGRSGPGLHVRRASAGPQVEVAAWKPGSIYHCSPFLPISFCPQPLPPAQAAGKIPAESIPTQLESEIPSASTLANALQPPPRRHVGGSFQPIFPVSTPVRTPRVDFTHC